MRIVYPLNMYRPYINGIGISIERQAIGLAQRGHETAIVAPSLSLADQEEMRDLVRVFRLKSIKVIADHWRLVLFPSNGFKKVLAAFDPDIVVVSLPFFLNRSAWQVARESARPLIGITGMMPEWLYYNLGLPRPLAKALNPSFWRLITNYYNCCDHVVGVTATALRFLERHGLNRPTTVISNGVALDRFYPSSPDVGLIRRLGLPDKPTVLYAGRLDAEKRMDVWVRSIPEVLNWVDAHFVIGGEGTERATLMEMVKSMGVENHVSFPGFLESGDYSRLYSLADVFAIASPAELQSIVTLEAAASGLPIVAVAAGALPELVHDGYNGFLFPLDDSQAMAMAIVRLLQDSELRRGFGQRSRTIAAEHDIRITCDKFERLYRDIIGRRLAA